MADGKNINLKFKQLAEAETDITDVVNTRIYNYEFVRRGRAFPNLTFRFSEGESWERIPAKRMTLELWYWVDDNNDVNNDPKVTIETLRQAVAAMINRNPSAPFNEIDTDANTGLRVVYCQRVFAEDEYDDETKKYFGNDVYDFIVSEGEDFDGTKDGNAVWNESSSSSSESSSSSSSQSSSSSSSSSLV